MSPSRRIPVRVRVRGLALVAAMVFSAAASPAHLLRPSSTGGAVAWDLTASAPNVIGGRITYFIDTAGVTGASAEEFTAAVRAAVKSWEEVPGCALRFQEDSSRPATGPSGRDLVNRFGFSKGALPYGVLGIAKATVVKDRIVDVDMTFNPDMLWSTGTPGTPGYGDIQAVATHEWGHGLGLNHSPTPGAAMYWLVIAGSIRQRTLAPDDMAGIARLYPDASFATDFGTLRGRVDLAGHSGDDGIVVTAIDFVTGDATVSTLTGKGGAYEMPGLAPGAYRLVATPLGASMVAEGAFGSAYGQTPTDFLPAVRGQDGAADGSTGVVVVEAGAVVDGLDMNVFALAGPGEPDDSLPGATGLGIGQSRAARMESTADGDWYVFKGQEGQRVSAYLHARRLGAELDAKLTLADAEGKTLDVSNDISADTTGPTGSNRDARILDFVLPEAGAYHLLVQAERPVDERYPQDAYYVLTLLPGGGEVSPLTSELVVIPSVLQAGTDERAVVTYRPRALTGGAVGAGLDVTLVAGNELGLPSPVQDMGDGTYTAEVAATIVPGTESLVAFVDGVPGGTAILRYRGPADAAGSSFSATPRRIRPGGTALLRFVPRDAAGIAFGPGHAVMLATESESLLGSTTDGVDGSYGAVLTASLAAGEVVLSATVDGVEVAGVGVVGVGFPVEEVIGDLLEDLEALAGADPAPGRKVLRSMLKARDLLAGIDPEGDPKVAGRAFKKAAKLMEKAGKGGAPVADGLRELAESRREQAMEAMHRVSQRTFAPSKASLRLEALLARAEEELEAGRWSRAVGLFEATRKMAAKMN